MGNVVQGYLARVGQSKGPVNLRLAGHPGVLKANVPQLDQGANRHVEVAPGVLAVVDAKLN